jgi:transposase-like protein
MTSVIKWSEIETECDGYRAGFVAIFKKYEGQPTDEKDEQGRTVKVSPSSFARHAGIPERTFRRWVEQDGRAGRPDPRDNRDRARRAARVLPPAEKLDLVRELMDDPEVGDQIVEAVEDEGIARRATRAAVRPAGPDPDEVAERVRRNVGRSLGHDTDQATDYLNSAANDLAHAVVAKETYGIDHPADEAEAIEKVGRWLDIYRSKTAVTADDRGWAESIGVQL